MSSDWPATIPGLSADESDFLTLLRAAVEGQPPAAPPADWQTVLRLTHQHMLTGFLYFHLTQWPEPCRPPAADFTRLRSTFFTTVARQQRIVGQTSELLAALARGRVRTVPLKGIWLADRIFPDAACRDMNDIDLLVAESDLATARTILWELGYTSHDFAPDQTGAKDQLFLKEGAPLPLELHWSLWREGTGPAAASPEAADHIWSNLIETTLYDQPVAVFPLERELTYLTEHILHHEWAVPLKALLDLALLVKQFGPSLDLQRLQAETQAWGIPFGCPFVIQVASDLFGSAPFEPLASLLAPAKAEREARQTAVTSLLQLTRASMDASLDLLKSVRGTPRERLRRGWSRLWLPSGDIRRLHPRAVRRLGLAGGYLVRAHDLLQRHGSKMFGGKKTAPDAADGLTHFQTRHNLINWITTRDQQT